MSDPQVTPPDPSQAYAYKANLHESLHQENLYQMNYQAYDAQTRPSQTYAAQTDLSLENPIHKILSEDNLDQTNDLKVNLSQSNISQEYDAQTNLSQTYAAQTGFSLAYPIHENLSKDTPDKTNDLQVNNSQNNSQAYDAQTTPSQTYATESELSLADMIQDDLPEDYLHQTNEAQVNRTKPSKTYAVQAYVAHVDPSVAYVTKSNPSVGYAAQADISQAYPLHKSLSQEHIAQISAVDPFQVNASQGYVAQANISQAYPLHESVSQHNLPRVYASHAYSAQPDPFQANPIEKPIQGVLKTQNKPSFKNTEVHPGICLCDRDPSAPVTPRKRPRKCICDTDAVLKEITGIPASIPDWKLNNIRLALFTERNSDGTRYLVLRGKDIYDRYRRRIRDTDIRAICYYCKESPYKITKLELCYNEITDAGFFKLLKKLLVKGRSSIIYLDIMNNNLAAKSVEYLATYATLIKLKYLRLNGNNLGTTGGMFLSQFLNKNKTVEFLDIGQTDQTLSSVSQIITALRLDHGQNKTLKCFDFSRINPLFNRYNVETKWLAYHIEFLLERNSTIIELHLQKNELISHDMEYLLRGLRRNNTLLYLDLGYNKIGDYGIELIANYLREKPQLINLNVAGNGIQDTGARALSFGLPYSKIKALDITNNKITDTGIIDILNTLKKPFRMRFLNLWGNKIKHSSCSVIQRMLDNGVLCQDTIDVKIYEVDEILHAAYYPNPSDRSKHLYYCELDYGFAQPIYHIKRNDISDDKPYKNKQLWLDKSPKCTL